MQNLVLSMLSSLLHCVHDKIPCWACCCCFLKPQTIFSSWDIQHICLFLRIEVISDSYHFRRSVNRKLQNMTD